MKRPEWKPFLAEYNRELLTYEEVVETLPSELIKAGWLGYPGATEEEIRTAEKRLAVRLPPSYRAFLKASNGWRFPSVSIFDLLPAPKVVWFREQNQDWIDAYVSPGEGMPPISDEEHLVYGPKQECVKFRVDYLQTALQISGPGDSAVALLNPKVVTPDGEGEHGSSPTGFPARFGIDRFSNGWRLNGVPAASNSTRCRRQRWRSTSTQRSPPQSRKPRQRPGAANASWQSSHLKPSPPKVTTVPRHRSLSFMLFSAGGTKRLSMRAGCSPTQARFMREMSFPT